MKTFLPAPLLLALAMTSCDKQVDVKKDPAKHLKDAYSLCRQYGDVIAADSLAYQLCIAEPSEAGKWKEEMAKVHFATGNNASCFKVVEDLIQHHSGAEKLPILEMKAVCLEGLNRKSEAIPAWKAAWEKMPSANHAVRLAGLFYQQGDYDEADKWIAHGLAAADAKSAFHPLRTGKGEMQKVPVAAVLHHLKALVIMKRDASDDNKVKAKKELEQAVEIAPDFDIAKRNLQGLETALNPKPMEMPEIPAIPEMPAGATTPVVPAAPAKK